MPYIPQDARDPLLSGEAFPNTSGELNFLITSIILTYLLDKGVGYDTMNSITGALEQVKDEFQRRVVHPYEDSKKVENGDLYPTLAIVSEVS